jgi:hypothetical protein
MNKFNIAADDINHLALDLSDFLEPFLYPIDETEFYDKLVQFLDRYFDYPRI